MIIFDDYLDSFLFLKEGLVSLGGFLRAMGCVMLAITAFVALFKSEVGEVSGRYDMLRGYI